MRWLYVILMYCGLAYSINLNGQTVVYSTDEFVSKRLNELILFYPTTDEFVSGHDYYDAIQARNLFYGVKDLGIEQNKDSAITMFIQQANKGNRYSAYYLFQIYAEQKKNMQEVAYLKKAATLGYHTAEYNLGTFYFGTPIVLPGGTFYSYKDRGIKENMDSAYYWFNKAIDDSDREMRISKNKNMYRMFDEWCTLYLANSFRGICDLIRGDKDNAEKRCILAVKKMELLAKWAFPAFSVSTYDDDTYDNDKCLYIANAYGRVVFNLICFYYATNQWMKAYKILKTYNDVCVDKRIWQKLPFHFSTVKEIDNDIDRTCFMGTALNRYLGHSLGDSFLQYAAEKGNKEAIMELGGKWLEELALKGNLEAKKKLIKNYFQNNDIESADYWWKKTIQESEIDSIVNRINYYSDDTLYYRYVLEKCANARSVKAQELLGKSYLVGNEYSKGFYWLEEASKKDCSSETNVMLGHCYRYGFGTSKNIEKAIDCYEKALQMEIQNNDNNTETGIYLAYSYDDIKEYSKAFALFQKLSEIYTIAIFKKGEYYYEGYAGIHDYKKAYECMKYMEKHGYLWAEFSRVQYYLGMCYLKGHAVPKDEKRGFDYLKSAVESKWVYPKVFWEIAKCYRFGRGVERDLKKAEYYEQEAEKAGNDDALWMKEQYGLLNIF